MPWFSPWDIVKPAVSMHVIINWVAKITQLMSNKVKKRYRSWQGARGAQGNLNCSEVGGRENLGTHRGVNTGCFAIGRKVRTFLLEDIFAHELKKVQE